MKDTLKTLLKSIEQNLWVQMVYPSTQPDGSKEPQARRLLASHLFETQAGNVCVVGYCSLRKALRTFRTDRAISVSLGTETVTPKDYQRIFVPVAYGTGNTVVFPAMAEHRYAKPMRLNGQLDDYLAAGWQRMPTPAVLGQSPCDIDEIGTFSSTAI